MSQITSAEGATNNEPNTVKQPKPVTTVKRHTEFFFDNTLIAIQIEDTLFNVHKYQLMKSTTFSDMFAITEESQDSSKKQEGLSPECPIVMSGVSSSDFECLMRVLYTRQLYVPPSHFSAQQPEPKASLIIPAFRLANMWNFTELCTYLIPLAEKVLNDVDKIVFARESQVTDWLLPAHVNLCIREQPITTQEARKLGIDSLLFISRFREEHAMKEGASHLCTNPKCECDLIDGYSCGSAYPMSTSQPATKSEAETKVREWSDNGCVLSN